MGILPRVKCGRCDRSYSGMKNRCPYCGARRNRGGKRAAQKPEPMARLIIGGLILLAILITVITVISLNLSGKSDRPAGADPPQTQQGQDGAGTDDPEEGGSDADPEGDDDGADPDGTPDPAQTPDPTPTGPPVTAVDITWRYKQSENEMTIGVGDKVDVECTIFPAEAEPKITWSSENTGICSVTVDPEDDTKIVIEGKGGGKTTITVDADGKTAELAVWVN